MHRGTLQGDVEWYCRKAVESGGPVLELGAGTGRVTIPIAEAGIRVSAVDLDAGMLDKLRQKAATLPDEARSRVTVHQGDMRSTNSTRWSSFRSAPFFTTSRATINWRLCGVPTRTCGLAGSSP